MAYNQARTSCEFWGESFHNCSDPVLQYDRSLFWCWWGGRKRVSFPIILLEKPENGETGLSLCVPLPLLHLRLNHQVNRFMGCDCHIETCHKGRNTTPLAKDRKEKSMKKFGLCCITLSMVLLA